MIYTTETSSVHQVDTRTKPLYRGTQVVWYILMVLEALLAFRFVLRALGANSYAGFTSFIYAVSRPFAAPFDSVFPSSRAVGSVIEWSTLLAMLVYWLVAWAIVKLFIMGKPVSTVEANEKLNQQDGDS
ncbi:YggT family protein [Patescibacteria group bacterium]|nr:YggT family protein [Patescibacteria group bacterium]